MSIEAFVQCKGLVLCVCIRIVLPATGYIAARPKLFELLLVNSFPNLNPAQSQRNIKSHTSCQQPQTKTFPSSPSLLHSTSAGIAIINGHALDSSTHGPSLVTPYCYAHPLISSACSPTFETQSTGSFSCSRQVRFPLAVLSSSGHLSPLIPHLVPHQSGRRSLAFCSLSCSRPDLGLQKAVETTGTLARGEPH